ncbi:MAG: GNAT family N-acetyltransferase, partial [Alteromonas sp.]|nr:GNAT family N-acetyltransferase [Alteromonas sp.]
MTASNYRITIIDSIEQISKERWQYLAKESGPFVSYEFLHALERSGSCSNESGWQPCHIAIAKGQHEAVNLVIPGYLKTHSYGEYVFDHAWANAYAQHGLDYYPKWISAIPFTPVTGSRLLSDGHIALTPSLLSELENTLTAHVESVFGEALSSFHWLFPNESTSAQITSSGTPKANDLSIEQLRDQSDTLNRYLTRYAVQFQWHNYGYGDFDDFLNALTSRKRKDIKKSRRKLNEQGVRFTHHTGNEISPETLQFFTKCYKATYLKRSGHVGYLNDAF